MSRRVRYHKSFHSKSAGRISPHSPGPPLRVEIGLRRGLFRSNELTPANRVPPNPWAFSTGCILRGHDVPSWCELFGLSSPHGSSLPTALLCSCATCSTRRRRGAGSRRVSSLAAHCVLSRCARVFMDVYPEFYRHSCFWDFIECCFHNMLV
jgi:hypothetical protein